MSKNPRNNTAPAPVAATNDKIDPNTWKFLTLGSVSLTDGRELVRDYNISFVINERNAEVIRDAAQFVLDNPTDEAGKPQRVSVNASPFYPETPETLTKYYSHRLYLSKDAVAKFGKTFSDYVKTKD